MVFRDFANWDLGPPCNAMAKGEISACDSAGRFATSSCSCHKMFASFDKYPHRLKRNRKQAITSSPILTILYGLPSNRHSHKMAGGSPFGEIKLEKKMCLIGCTLPG